MAVMSLRYSPACSSASAMASSFVLVPPLLAERALTVSVSSRRRAVRAASVQPPVSAGILLRMAAASTMAVACFCLSCSMSASREDTCGRRASDVADAALHWGKVSASAFFAFKDALAASARVWASRYCGRAAFASSMAFVVSRMRASSVSMVLVSSSTSVSAAASFGARPASCRCPASSAAISSSSAAGSPMAVYAAFACWKAAVSCSYSVFAAVRYPLSPSRSVSRLSFAATASLRKLQVAFSGAGHPLSSSRAARLA